MFKMKVKDIFFIGDKVILAGDLKTDLKNIKKLSCRLLVNGNPHSNLLIEGEVFSRGARDLWTKSKVSLSRNTLENNEITLIPTE